MLIMSIAFTKPKWPKSRLFTKEALIDIIKFLETEDDEHERTSFLLSIGELIATTLCPQSIIDCSILMQSVLSMSLFVYAFFGFL